MAKIRKVGDGEVTCEHRSMSVCPACFESTPGLIEVYSVWYKYTKSAWTAAERAEFRKADGALVGGCRVSPGTVI